MSVGKNASNSTVITVCDLFGFKKKKSYFENACFSDKHRKKIPHSEKRKLIKETK